MTQQQRVRPTINIGLIAALAIAGIVLVVLFVFGRNFFYLISQVAADEVGVQFESGRITGVVGPGVYSDFGLYVELKRVSSQAVKFDIEDPELITADKQRIGLRVTGDAFRPGLINADVLQTKWAQYSTLFLDDAVAADRVQDLAKQSMKVCVGERNFDDAVIGTARDELRACIDEELSQLAENYGLQIENVVVPEVILSPEVQAALDSIVQSRLATEKAAQDKLRVEAEAAAEQSRQEGEIKVAQARIQEEARQQTTLAKLNEEKLIAEQAVIEAQKANDLLAAEQDLAINVALAAAATEKAKADLAEQLALAELYANNPAYVQLQIAATNASALNETDKIIFTPEGVTPTIVLPGPGITPTVNVDNPE
jgi:hypothetical protein